MRGKKDLAIFMPGVLPRTIYQPGNFLLECVMAEGRMLKKRIAYSKKIAALHCDRSRTLYFMAYPHLDIEGRIEADPVLLKARVAPLLSWLHIEVEDSLKNLYRVGLIILYKADDNLYAQFTKFTDFQKIRKDREAQSAFPSPTPENSCELLSNQGKVKLSKDKISQVNKRQASPALQAAFNKMPLNIYALIGKLKKEVGWPKDHLIPEEVLLKVCGTYSRGKVKKAWPWFTTSIKRACEDYTAKKNIEEGEKFKKAPISAALKGLIERIGG